MVMLECPPMTVETGRTMALEPLLDPAILKAHEELLKMPGRTAQQLALLIGTLREADFSTARTVKVLPDKITVIYGFDIVKAAIQLQKLTIACEIVSPKDIRSYILDQMIEDGHLGHDQYAYLAWTWRNHRSELYRSRRAMVAAAARHRNISNDPDDLLDDGEVHDARYEAAKRFGVSEARLKKLDRIAEQAPDFLSLICDGTKTIKDVIRRLDIQAQEEEREARWQEIENLPDLDQWMQGDPAERLSELPEGTGRLLILDSTDPVEICECLHELSGSKGVCSSLYIRANWKNEPAVRWAIEKASYAIVDRLVWNTEGNAATNGLIQNGF